MSLPRVSCHVNVIRDDDLACFVTIPVGTPNGGSTGTWWFYGICAVPSDLGIGLQHVRLRNVLAQIIQHERPLRIAGGSLQQHLSGMKVGNGSRARWLRPRARHMQCSAGMAARCGRSNQVQEPQDCALGRTVLAGQPFLRVDSRRSSRRGGRQR